MEKGKIIFLNGVTSTGKTSIVDAIQSISEEFYYVVANDLFVQMIGDKYLQENYWKYESQAIYLMYHAAKLYSDMGKNIIIDGSLLETPELPQHYETVKEIFKTSPLFMVEVYCPLEICRQRNIERGDRHENQSFEQAEIMTKNVAYDCTVHTNEHTPEECAEYILKHLF